MKLNNLIKVAIDKEEEAVMMRRHIGDVTNKNDKVVATLSVAMNGLTPLVEVDGNIFKLDLDLFVSEILANKDKYLKEYRNKTSSK